MDNEIKKRRVQVMELHAELEDLEDYLDILEARKNSIGKRTYSQSEMGRRHGRKSGK